MSDQTVQTVSIPATLWADLGEWLCEGGMGVEVRARVGSSELFIGGRVRWFGIIGDDVPAVAVYLADDTVLVPLTDIVGWEW